MDELKNLRPMMKKETFKNHGFTNKMRNNIVNGIDSNKPEVSFQKKPMFAKVLSFVFIAACLSLFIYFGGTQLGMIEGNNASSISFHELKISDKEKLAELGNEFKFPSKLPFKVEDITIKTNTDPLGNKYSVHIVGKKNQTMILSFRQGIRDIELTGEGAKIGSLTGNYHESKRTGNNSITWLEDQILYEMIYKPGESDVRLNKADMIKLAKSFN
jgi:hypothetical protein